MDLRQLKYFLVIAEEGQITSAAKRLNMAQPPLSQQMKMLESELGVQLLERGSRSVRLTEAGQVLRDRAEQVFELLNTTRRELKDFHAGIRGTLSIGTVASLGVALLPAYIREFREQYPQVTFQLWEGDTHRITELLKSGVVEIGIVRSAHDEEIFHSISLPAESLAAAVHRKFGDIITDSRYLSLADLKARPLSIHRRMESLILQCCIQAGFEPEIVCKGDDVRSLLAWADHGVGIALIPRSAVDLVPTAHLHFYELVNPRIELPQTVIWRKQGYVSAQARGFLQKITDIVSGSP
ncbi:LysR family transcriptional regulator [Sporomusa aerivorans]|uniref:LysR family transcriptional regulator n=1 Tax=Sporomusa aerivorans TaxID=204936 RepID=UPI003529FA54